MPPGTGDIALTLSQRVPLTGAVIVTTPQDIALLDAKQGPEDVREGRRADPRASSRTWPSTCCPNCGHTEHIFGADGGRSMAERVRASTTSARLPLTMSIREQADSGRPTVVADPDGEIAGHLQPIARTVAVKIAQKAKDFSSKFPTISVSKST